MTGVLLPQPRSVGRRTDRPLPPQGYRLIVRDDGTSEIDAADDAGRFYAEQTLRQLGPSPRPTVIEDWPDVLVRGVMLDVSRDKVPTMTTLFGLVDRLSSLKINHLQLYMEHTFAYDGHDEVWAAASPFTPDEIRDLDAHCKTRYVELSANQNCLGHMERWLKFDRYRPLAIRPDGWTDARGRTRQPTTLDPAKPQSLELVRELLGQLLPNFTSPRVNVGLDEPWELADERFGEYLDYIRALRAAPELDGREMLMWGDIVAQHPERAKELPDGVTIAEWGYEADHPFDARAASLAGFGLPFWVCPGTSSWNTVVGRWTNMRDNCTSAARAAVRHGAGGYLVTDWGDNGHLQYLPFSAPGFATAAAMSWCAETNQNLDLEAALSAHVTLDASGEIAAAMHELGDVHRVITPQLPNTSVLALALMLPTVRVGEGFTAGITGDELEEVRQVTAAAVSRLGRATSVRPDAALIVDEVRNGAELLDVLVDDLSVRLAAGGSIDHVGQSERRRLATRLAVVRDRHRGLWLARNREGGLDDSCSRLDRLIALYEGGGGK
ncbi:MAG TPA: family 20 glycosylhydrolase [Acidimicrobiales bacterium]|nr:family 20 glycosylhydrolase [Acidimicrobiales bacterium]